MHTSVFTFKAKRLNIKQKTANLYRIPYSMLRTKVTFIPNVHRVPKHGKIFKNLFNPRALYRNYGERRGLAGQCRDSKLLSVFQKPSSCSSTGSQKLYVVQKKCLLSSKRAGLNIPVSFAPAWSEWAMFAVHQFPHVLRLRSRSEFILRQRTFDRVRRFLWQMVRRMRWCKIQGNEDQRAV